MSLGPMQELATGLRQVRKKATAGGWVLCRSVPRFFRKVVFFAQDLSKELLFYGIYCSVIFPSGATVKTIGLSFVKKPTSTTPVIALIVSSIF